MKILILLLSGLFCANSLFAVQVIQQSPSLGEAFGRGFREGLEKSLEHQRQKELLEYEYRLKRQQIEQEIELKRQLEEEQRLERYYSKIVSSLLKGYEFSKHQEYVMKIWLNVELPYHVKQQTINFLEKNLKNLSND